MKYSRIFIIGSTIYNIDIRGLIVLGAKPIFLLGWLGGVGWGGVERRGEERRGEEGLLFDFDLSTPCLQRFFRLKCIFILCRKIVALALPCSTFFDLLFFFINEYQNLLLFGCDLRAARATDGAVRAV